MSPIFYLFFLTFDSIVVDNQIEKYGEYQEVTVSKENLDRKNPITTFVENFKDNKALEV